MIKPPKPQLQNQTQSFLTSGLLLGAFFFTMLSVCARILGPADVVELGTSLMINLFVFIAVSLWVLHVLLTGKMQWTRTRLNSAAGIFTLLMIVSAFRAPSLLRSIPVMIEWLANILLFYLVIQFAVKQNALRILMRAVVACAAVVSLYSLVQYYHSLEVIAQQLLDSPQEVLQAMGQPESELEAVMGRVLDKRVFATFTNPNSFAGFLLLTIPLSFGMLADTCRRRREAALSEASAIFAAVALQLFAFYLTFSKGGMLCLIFSALVFAVFAARASIRRAYNHLCGVKGRLLCMVSVAVLAVAAIAGAYLAASNTPLGSRIMAGVKSMNVRIGYWKAGAGMIADHPLLGVGLDNFGTRYSEYKPATASETQRAHNHFIQVAADMGLTGLAAFCLLWGGIIWAVMPRRCLSQVANLHELPEHGESRATLLTALGAGIFALLLAASIFGSLDVSENMAAWLIGYALMAGGWLYILMPRRGTSPPSAGAADDAASRTSGIQAGRSGAAYGEFARLGIAVGLAGFLLHNLVDFDMYVPGCSQTAWLFAALGICMQPALAPKEVKVAPALQIIMAVISIGCSALLLLPERGLLARVNESEANVSMASHVLQTRPEAANGDKITDRHLRGARENLQRAIRFYEQAGEANPLDENVQHQLGMLHLQLLQLSDWRDAQGFHAAIKHFKRKIELNPHDSSTWYTISRLYRDAAIENRGLLLRNLDRRDVNTVTLAKEELNRTKMLGGSVRINSRQYDYLPSIWAALHAIRLYPTKAEYHFQLAETCALANLPDLMRQHLERALELDRLAPEDRLKLSDSQRDAAKRRLDSLS